MPFALLAFAAWALFSQGSPFVASLGALLAWLAWGVTSVRARARELERAPLRPPPGWETSPPTELERELLARRNILVHPSSVVVSSGDPEASRWVLCWVSPDEDLETRSPTGVH
jgi:hypothetical protein